MKISLFGGISPVKQRLTLGSACSLKSAGRKGGRQIQCAHACAHT